MASILVITQRVPYPPNKGEKLRTYHQLEYLHNLGHSLTVLSPIDTVNEFTNANDLANKLNIKVITKPLKSKVFRFLLGILKGRSLSESNFFTSKLMNDVDTFAKEADVILCSASSLARYVFSLRVINKPLLLMDFMDVDSDKWLQYADNSNWPMNVVYKREHKLIKRLEQKVMAHFDTAFVIAQAEFDLFQSKVLHCDNLQILGNGIDQNEFKPAHVKTEFIDFLFTGVMDYKPNVDAVLWFVNECWSTIKEKVPNARLTIAGMNPDQRIRALTNDNAIEVTGFVDDIMPFFNRADVFIAPFQIARGVQNKVLQAMSCGIPVVTTTLGAEGIISEQNTNMVIADTHNSFTEACLFLANDEETRKKIGSKAYNTITEKYSWPSVLKPLKYAIETNRKDHENGT
ncbi:TIGR03087 family PEP-CTERM/XrtA system glycosyltransferase [Glaciecola sp. SC05]|uniref:TIGR03087 family PEP-CTERM/XrtA system glycosyltransferase n=1 Tax=Glaciecola sp. SC05 TaxID=1987355 RepID=UPI003528B469